MRKMNRIAAAALAVVMAVGVMAMPAFATSYNTKVGENVSDDTFNWSSTNTDDTAKTGTASTDVHLVYSTAASQLSVTVPISVTFAVKSTGDFVCPTDKAYYIENNSVVPVHVEGIKAEFDKTGSSAKFSNYSFVSSDTTLTTGQVYLKMSQSGSSETDDEVTSTTGSATFEKELKKSDLAGSWNIKAKKNETSASGVQMQLKFEGKMFAGDIDASWANSDVKMCTITYTIAAGTDSKTSN